MPTVTFLGGLGGLLLAIAVFEALMLLALVAASLARSQRSARVAEALAGLESAWEGQEAPLPWRLGRDLARELLSGPPATRGRAVPPRAAAAGRAPAGERLRALLARRRDRAQTENALGLLAILRGSAQASEADILERALASGDPGLEVHAAAVLGSRASRFASFARPVADTLRRTPGLGRLTLAWTLRELLRAEPGWIAPLARDPQAAIRRAAFAAAASWSARPESRSYSEWLAALGLQGIADADERVRVLACTLLVAFPSPAGVEALTAAVTRGSNETRAAAARALAAIGTSESVLALATRLRKAGPGLVLVIVEALASAPGPPPPELLSWLSEADAEGALAAVRAIGALPGASAHAPSVLPLLQHGSEVLRAETARACGRFLRELPRGAAREAVVSALGSCLARERDLGVVVALGRALALSGDARAAEALLGAIASAPAAARELLLESLALLELLRARPAARLPRPSAAPGREP